MLKYVFICIAAANVRVLQPNNLHLRAKVIFTQLWHIISKFAQNALRFTQWVIKCTGLYLLSMLQNSRRQTSFR